MQQNDHAGRISILLFFASMLLGGIAAYIYGKSTDDILFIVFYAGAGCAAATWLYRKERDAQLLDYDNVYHSRRFFVLYFVMILVSVILAYLPADIWPYTVIFLILGLFSNTVTGLFAGSWLLLLTMFLSNSASMGYLFVYLLSGMVALVLFRRMDEGFLVTRPMFVALLLLFALLLGHHVLFEKETLTGAMVLLPAINVFACLVLASVVLNYFGRHVVRRSNDMYMEINDPEYEMMVDLKEHNKEAYFLAIHSAYLAERIAIDLDMDVRATKACAYYHSACKALGGEEGASAYAEKKGFPEGAIELIEEYENPPATGYVSKEAAVINICETLVRMIKSIFNKDKDAKVDYDSMIDKIFEHHWEKGDMNLNNISFGDMTRMKKLLKKEKLYYDFLR
ncbi:MAG: hypothetical protein IJR58_05700 [Lachnospiraceae bacterium]|nr:hypothetical protein [Lachnospiraceae bacterium]